jgi:hypothetical protein
MSVKKIDPTRKEGQTMKRSLLGLAVAAGLGAALLLFAGGCVPYTGYYYGGPYGTYYGDPYGYYDYYGDYPYDNGPGGLILDFGYGRYGTFHHDYDRHHDYDHDRDRDHDRDFHHGH